MKNYRCLLLLMLLSFPMTAQQPKVLNGYLGVERGASYSYKLVYSDSSGFISGYSYTWLYEQKEVKAAITGFIDKKNKTLSFRETGILYNHGFESDVTICLINAVLHCRQENGSQVLSGPISSKDLSNVYCGQGTISFTDRAAIDQLFHEEAAATAAPAPVATPAHPAKPMRIVYDTAVSAPVQKTVLRSPDEPEKITAGAGKTYNWNTDTLKLNIWDGGKIDGDLVTLVFNNVPVLTNYALKKESKTLAIPLSGNGVDSLVILAVNEGSELLNTANLLLMDGSIKYPVIAYNAVAHKAVIRIRRVRK